MFTIFIGISFFLLDRLKEVYVQKKELSKKELSKNIHLVSSPRPKKTQSFQIKTKEAMVSHSS